MNDTGKFLIREGKPEDAPAISRIIQMAMHKEGCMALVGSEERFPLLDKTFTILATRPDSQYSYLNTIVAEDCEGRIAGAIVSYDGALLHPLRRAFVEVANEITGSKFIEEEMDLETSDDEIYLDSLAVFPEYRGKGLAKRLIEAALTSHAHSGKPFGLLCAPGNDDAYRLYERLGFRETGLRPFAGIKMHRMIQYFGDFKSH